MKATKEDIDRERELQTDIWCYRKRFYNPEDSEEYWNDVVSVATEIGKKYNNDPYVKDMLTACAMDFDRRFREKMKEEEYENI